mmetsp:Transcript_3066/g.6192  ORF Transcript_3066/g.6192 Transcript_3066/m.6192 type:complete len:431 (+) Transcript_3066:97-1389(+)
MEGSLGGFHLFDLDEVRDVHGHLLDLGVVELLDVTEVPDVSLGEEVDSYSLPTETSGTSDTVDVVLTVSGEVEVDDKTDLLDVDTTGEEIGGNEDAGGTGAELAHDDVTLPLVHVSVHTRDGEVPLLHVFLKPVNLPPGVAVDDGLGDGKSLIEIAEGVELPLLPLDGDVELLDTLEGKLVLLDEDPHGVPHEPLRDLEDVEGHGGREEADLNRLREELEDVVNLVLESSGEHLVSLVEEELPDGVKPERAPVNHIIDTSGGTDDDVDAGLEGADVVADGCAADAGVDSYGHVVAEGDYDLLDLLGELAGGGEDKGLAFLEGNVELGEGADSERCGLSGSGLSLGDKVASEHAWLHGPLLDGGGLLETVGVDPPKEILWESHGVEGLDRLVPVGLDIGVGDAAEAGLGGWCGVLLPRGSPGLCRGCVFNN